jgi:segregation and condensation protein A
MSRPDPGQLEIPTPVEVPVQGAPIGRVRGVPLFEMPADLYIPPDALEVFFETFEGPLDLLLYLIRKANLEILDIPMAKLTAQYMVYVEAMRSRNLELAAEYLVMAATLMEIKSRMLLPRPKHVEDGEEDPRAELVRRLLEYERMKLASLGIDRLPQAGREFLAVEVWMSKAIEEQLPDISAVDLENAWRSLLMRAKLSQHHRVSREELSVREHMSQILRRLSGGGFSEFCSLFDPDRGVAVLVVNFLAVLELVRESLIEVTQSQPFDPIYVRLAHGQSE